MKFVWANANWARLEDAVVVIVEETAKVTEGFSLDDSFGPMLIRMGVQALKRKLVDEGMTIAQAFASVEADMKAESEARGGGGKLVALALKILMQIIQAAS